MTENASSRTFDIFPVALEPPFALANLIVLPIFLLLPIVTVFKTLITPFMKFPLMLPPLTIINNVNLVRLPLPTLPPHPPTHCDSDFARTLAIYSYCNFLPLNFLLPLLMSLTIILLFTFYTLTTKEGRRDKSQ